MTRRTCTLIIITLLLTVYSVVLFDAQSLRTSTIHSQMELHAARVLNATVVSRNEAVQIYTVINNPETWTLHNMTGYFIIRPAVKLIIVDVLNITNISTTRYEFVLEEYVNITFEIVSVKPQEKFIHWVIVRFGAEGIYNIISGEISGVRTKGELKEEFTLSVNNASIKVTGRTERYPPEGTKDATLLVILSTIYLPLVLIGSIGKISKRHG